MSLSSETNKTIFNCTGGTTYDTDFKIFEDTEAEIVRIDSDGVETILTYTTSYSISLITDSGFRVTTVETYSDGQLVARRSMPKTQDADWERNGDFSTDVLEEQLDKVIMMIQEHEEKLDRSILQDATQEDVITFPTAESNKLIGWNSGATALENKTALDADVQAACEAAQTAAELAETNAEAAQVAAEAAAASIPTLDTDGTLAANSDTKIASQKATKTYADTKKILTDRGDPASVDVAVGSLTTDGSWHDLDLSSIVPAGASFVVLYVELKDDAASSSILFRKNGNSNAMNVGAITTQVANILTRGDIIVACDSNRVIEYLTSNLTFDTINITVKGWTV